MWPFKNDRRLWCLRCFYVCRCLYVKCLYVKCLYVKCLYVLHFGHVKCLYIECNRHHYSNNARPNVMPDLLQRLQQDDTQDGRVQLLP